MKRLSLKDIARVLFIMLKNGTRTSSSHVKPYHNTTAYRILFVSSCTVFVGTIFHGTTYRDPVRCFCHFYYEHLYNLYNNHFAASV